MLRKGGDKSSSWQTNSGPDGGKNTCNPYNREPNGAKVKQNHEVSDVVLLKDKELVRGNLRLARIVETTLSRERLVRKVKRLMADSDLNKMGNE